MTETLVLDKLGIRNFLSYGNNTTIINLNFNMATLILGRNLDCPVDGQIDSNGAGKTTIRHALTYVCYDRTMKEMNSDEIKVNNLINNINKKNMMIFLEFHKNNKYYRIERFRKLAKVGTIEYGTGVYFLCKSDLTEPWNYKAAEEGGHDITNASTDDVNVAIEHVIGLPFAIFSRLIIISATFAPFLSLKLDEQRTIIEELFGFTELAENAEKLKKWISDNNKNLDILQKLDDQIKLEVIRYNKQVFDIKQQSDTWNINKQLKIDRLKHNISEHHIAYGKVDYAAEEKNFLNIQQLSDQITKIKNNSLLLNQELKTLNDKLTNIKTWDKTHVQELTSLETKLKQPILFKNMEEIQAFNNALSDYDAKLSCVNDDIANITTKITAEHTIEKSLQMDITHKQEELIRLEKEIKEIDNELKKLLDSKCPYCLQDFLEAKTKIKNKNQTKLELQEKINKVKDIIVAKEREIKTTREKVEPLLVEKENKNNNILQIKKDKTEFVHDITNVDTIIIKDEIQKTENYQKLTNSLKIKVNESNPFLKNSSIEELTSAISIVQGEINELQGNLIKTQTEQSIRVNNLIFKNYNDIAETKFKLKEYETELQKLELQENPCTETILNLEKIPPSNPKTQDIQDLSDTILHQDFLLKLLTKKDSFIRKALLNRYLNNLNTNVRKYLDKLGLPHIVKLQDDMTVKITQFKNEIELSGLSSGQKARINIALAFAFRDILKSRFGSINLCILDECLDIGLGSVGVQLAVKMIKSIAKENKESFFVISHKDEIASSFESKMMIELQNGFSTVVES